MGETSYPYLHEFNITKDIRGYFFDAGHILGSSGVVITDGDYTFTYTGDISLQSHGVHSGAKLPNIDNLDCLLIESTTSSETKVIKEEEQWQIFFDNINDALIRRSRILIPAFALGRSQDIIALIDYGKRKGIIHDDMPVYLIGLGNAITEIYEKKKSVLRKELCKGSFFDMFKSLRFDDLMSNYNGYKYQNRSAIYICTNGMMEPGTPAAVIGAKMITDPNETIIFSGYQSPSTLGYEVLNSKIGSILDFGENREEHIQIKTPYISQVRLSGHGSMQDMIDITTHLDPRNIAVIHGAESSVENLMKRLNGRDSKILGPKTGETLLLRTPGNKTIRSKRDIKAHIVTVGTSLNGNYSRKNDGETPTLNELVKFIFENKNNDRACSAEIQTMNGMKIQQSDYLYFISSGEEVGVKCGNALQQAYSELGFYCQNIIINDLTSNYDQFKTKGLPQFIHALVKIIEDHGENANIIATGGFKAQTAYASMIGSLTNTSVYYIHEDFHNVIELPGLPIGLDFSAWTTYLNMIDYVLIQNEIEKAKEIMQKQLPEFMQILLHEDSDLNQMILTPVGELIKRLHSEYLLSQNNIASLNCSEKTTHLFGRGSILIKDIPNHELRIILNRMLLQNKFIRKINIGKQVGEVSDCTKIKFHHRENEKLFYQILTREGGQEIIIHTYPGVEKEFINRVGQMIYV